RVTRRHPGPGPEYHAYMTTGTNGAGPAPSHRWRPGDHILWRYRAYRAAVPATRATVGGGADAAAGDDAAAFHICRPVTVVEDSPDLLAAWMAPGTACVRPALLDGTPLHEEPL